MGCSLRPLVSYVNPAFVSDSTLVTTLRPSSCLEKKEELGCNKENEKREVAYMIAAMQAVDMEMDQTAIRPPKRRNVRISREPQSVAARERRQRISEKLRILRRMVPGGSSMDTASMLDEAARYVKFLQTHLHFLTVHIRSANAHPTIHLHYPS